MRVKNKIISFFFNRFDFIIRFLYCKFNFIRKILYWKIYSSDYLYLDKRFEHFKKILRKHNTSIKNKTILELGPGNSLVMAYNFLMNDAKKVILVDKYPLNAYKYVTTNIDKHVLINQIKKSNKTNKQKIFLQKELEYIKIKYSKTKLPFIRNSVVDKNYLLFIAKDLSELKDIPKIDILISNSVLEHVENVENSILAMSRIISKNGILIHSIDFKDHYNFNRPFLFYKYSDKIWRKYLTKVGVSYTNRIRYDDFIDLFNKYGFDIISEKKIILPVNEKRINKKFLNRKDLNVASVELVLKRKHNNNDKLNQK